MTRLEEIEEFINVSHETLGMYEIRWLINRIKKLTDALEYLDEKMNFAIQEDFSFIECLEIGNIQSKIKKALEEE